MIARQGGDASWSSRAQGGVQQPPVHSPRHCAEALLARNVPQLQRDAAAAVVDAPEVKVYAYSRLVVVREVVSHRAARRLEGERRAGWSCAGRSGAWEHRAACCHAQSNRLMMLVFPVAMSPRTSSFRTVSAPAAIFAGGLRCQGPDPGKGAADTPLRAQHKS